MRGDRSSGTGAIARYLVGLALIVAALVAARLILGRVFGNPVRPVTVVGLLAGAVAGFVMTELYPFVNPGAPAPWVQSWARYDEDAVGERAIWSGNTVLIAALATAGGAYPWVATNGVGLTEETVTTLPSAVWWAVAWAGVLYVASVVVFLLTRGLSVSRSGARQWVVLAGLFVVDGVVYGFVVGVWQSVWAPLIGG